MTPADPTAMARDSPAPANRSRRSASAIGERHWFAVQTNSTRAASTTGRQASDTAADHTLRDNKVTERQTCSRNVRYGHESIPRTPHTTFVDLDGATARVATRAHAGERPVLDIHLLGPFSVEHDGRRLGPRD